MAKSKDLFDESTMSFGEHLEVLRLHLWKAIIGLTVCVIVALFFGNHVIAIVSRPINRALDRYGVEAEQDVQRIDWWDRVTSYFGGGEAEQPHSNKGTPNAGAGAQQGSPENETSQQQTPHKEGARKKAPQTKSSPEQPPPGQPPRDTSQERRPEGASQPPPAETKSPDQGTITVQIRPSELLRALHQVAPDRFPAPAENPDEETIALTLRSSSFERYEQTAVNMRKPVTLNVQEAFFTYLKVSIVAGLVLASPWIFYQLWLFVAAGLYPHERRYVHVYLPVSVVLFLAGVLLCFFGVFPVVLNFLLGFNEWLDFQPQIRMSEWITFAITLPLMFGVSFQLPLVMLFLERISIFDAEDYRSKRRMAVLVIAVLSMLLTPSDPVSMLMMMLPLVALYELGIWMCGFSPARSPFEDAEAI